MSWQRYLDSVSFPFPIPVTLTASVVNGVEHIAAELTVRCHETGETIKVKTRRAVMPLGEMTDEEAAKAVRDVVRIASNHEIDEALTIGGERVFDPHRRRR